MKSRGRHLPWEERPPGGVRIGLSESAGVGIVRDSGPGDGTDTASPVSEQCSALLSHALTPAYRHSGVCESYRTPRQEA